MIQMPRRLFTLFVLAAPALLIAQQPDTARIAATVITATRVPVSLDASPAAVSVVSGADLRLRGVTTVVDALRSLPGVQFAQSGAEGSNSSLFLRGGESKYVKVLVDGVPVNDPGGAFDFGTMTVDDIDHIELVRGPASVVYGADAVTGVIQIFTRRGHGGPRTSVSARAGSYDSRDLDGDVSGALSNGDYSLGLARHDTKGIYAFNSGYASTVLSGRTRLMLDSRTDLRVNLRYTDYLFHYPTNGGGQVVDSNAFRSQDRTTVGVDIGRFWVPRVETRLSLTSNGTAGGTDDRPDTPSSGGFESLDRTRRRGADLRTNVGVAPATTLTVGAQAEQEDQRSETQVVFGSFQSTDIFHAMRRNAAGYAQILTTVANDVSLTGGARVDRNQQFGAFDTYRVGGNWRVVGETRLRASVGTAFREPSFFENYATGYVTGNPRLQPERSLAWEAAASQTLLDGGLTATVTHFAQRFRNMIDYTGDTTACGASYCNVARADANGNEFELAVSLIPSLRLAANLTHLDTKVLEPGFDTSSAGLYLRGDQLIRRPTTSWNASATYSNSHGGLDAQVSHVGRRSDRDFTQYPAAPVIDPAYTTVDLGGEVPVTTPAAGRPATSLTLRVENLFDATYQSIYNFPMPKRSVFAGARVTF